MISGSDLEEGPTGSSFSVSTRWTTTLSSKVNLTRAIDFRACYGATLVTLPDDIVEGVVFGVDAKEGLNCVQVEKLSAVRRDPSSVWPRLESGLDRLICAESGLDYNLAFTVLHVPTLLESGVRPDAVVEGVVFGSDAHKGPTSKPGMQPPKPFN